MSAANVKARSAGRSQNEVSVGASFGAAEVKRSGRSHKKPASEAPWTRKLWIYDLRTNKHFTLKTNPLKREDLDAFVQLYNPANRHDRKATWSEAGAPSPQPVQSRPCMASPLGRREAVLRETPPSPPARGEGAGGRWRVYGYDELVARDKASLDIFRLKDDSLPDSDNLPPPEVIAQEIVDDLEAALEQFRLIAPDLNGISAEPPSA